MRTEIERHYKSGFLLPEQELRRIVQSGQQHAAKIGALQRPKLSARMKDVSLVETEDIDEILSLENGGQKEVTTGSSIYLTLSRLPRNGHSPLGSSFAQSEVVSVCCAGTPARWIPSGPGQQGDGDRPRCS